MNCPVCKKPSLTAAQPETGLFAHKCSECSGYWITPLEFERWLATAPASETSAAPIELSSKEKSGAKFCPNSGHLLVKYRVSADLDFALNRCGACGGVWFDGNEWEILKAHNLHSGVTRVFTEQWQTQVRRDETEKAMDSIWEQHIGAADMEEARRIKNWLENHEKRNELYAFILNNSAKQKASKAK